MSERATKHDFLTLLRGELIARYGETGWARDADRLDSAMNKMAETISGTRNLMAIDGESVVAAWRGMGLKGKPTFKGLRALPAH